MVYNVLSSSHEVVTELDGDGNTTDAATTDVTDSGTESQSGNDYSGSYTMASWDNPITTINRQTTSGTVIETTSEGVQSYENGNNYTGSYTLTTADNETVTTGEASTISFNDSVTDQESSQTQTASATADNVSWSTTTEWGNHLSGGYSATAYGEDNTSLQETFFESDDATVAYGGQSAGYSQSFVTVDGQTGSETTTGDNQYSSYEQGNHLTGDYLLTQWNTQTYQYSGGQSDSTTANNSTTTYYGDYTDSGGSQGPSDATTSNNGIPTYTGNYTDSSSEQNSDSAGATESGTDSYTSTERGNQVTGDSSTTTSGSDVYTLTTTGTANESYNDDTSFTSAEGYGDNVSYYPGGSTSATSGATSTSSTLSGTDSYLEDDDANAFYGDPSINYSISEAYTVTAGSSWQAQGNLDTWSDVPGFIPTSVTASGSGTPSTTTTGDTDSPWLESTSDDFVDSQPTPGIYDPSQGNDRYAIIAQFENYSVGEAVSGDGGGMGGGPTLSVSAPDAPDPFVTMNGGDIAYSPVGTPLTFGAPSGPVGGASEAIGPGAPGAAEMSAGAQSGQVVSGAATDAVFSQLGAGLLQQYCFPAGTPITTKRGEVPIEQVEIGDEVLAAHEHDPDGPLGWKPVIQLYRNKPAELINIHVGDLPVIRATLNHPFYVRDKGFVSAEHLQPRDILRTADDRWVPVTETFRNGDIEPVFNFSVADFHTYLAGGVLVHNDSWFSSAWNSVSSAAASAASAVGSAASAVATRADQFAGQVGMLALDGRWIDKEGASGVGLLSGAADGLETSGKVLVNGTAKAVVSTATFGQVEAGDVVEVNDYDRKIGYDGAVTIVKGSAEVLIGAATGSAATKLADGNKLAQVVGSALRAHDAASNVVDVATGVNDIAQNGANLQNVVQVAAGTLATAGDLAGAARSKAAAKAQDAVYDEATGQLRVLDTNTGCFTPDTLVTVVDSAACSSSGGLGVAATTTCAIRSVVLGSRVVGENPDPLGVDHEFAEPESATWVEIAAVVQRADGTRVEAELLRPRDWARDRGIRPGARLSLRFGEVGGPLQVDVLSVQPCPPIATGEGHVVTGRFVSRDIGNLLRLTLSDETTVRVTDTHPFWSESRQEWVAAGELVPGEQLNSLGAAVSVACIERLGYASAVYNLEVHGQHVFRVADPGVLVHNSGVCPKGGAPSKVATPTIKEAGKIADNVPTSVPKNWSKADIENALIDYKHSIEVRKAEQEAFDAVGGGDFWRRKDHFERIVEEENFARQLKQALEEMR